MSDHDHDFECTMCHARPARQRWSDWTSALLVVSITIVACAVVARL